MSELKPCPFCGGDAEVRHSVTCGYDSYWVECKDFQNCRGSVSPVTDVESVAVEAWNTRHVETCHDKNGFDESLGFECTVCRTMVDSYMQTTCSDKREQFHYCPNCGRKVEG